jgi:hypothetical protein
MRLTGLDFFFWAAGFVVSASLLLVLWYRHRARKFPFFTALISLTVIKSIVLYLVRAQGTHTSYVDTYWSLTVLDTVLQLCVVYEIASSVFRPVDVWARDVRRSFLWLVSLSLLADAALTWLASPPAPTWVQAFATRGNLFAAALMSQLFVAMMGLSIRAGLAWKTHVAKIAQGLGAYSLISVVTEAGHSYFGAARGLPGSIALSHLRMAAYLVCGVYWSSSLWPDEQSARAMTKEMRGKLFTLQVQVDYYLQDLRSRTKL